MIDGPPVAAKSVLEPLHHIECRDARLPRTFGIGLAPLPSRGGQGAVGSTRHERLNDLREHWLNSPEGTERVAEATSLGMAVMNWG